MSKSRAATIDVTIGAKTWRTALPTVAAIVRRAANAALAGAKIRRAVEVSVMLTTDASVRRLNATYRGKDKPTNVLSFPAGDAVLLGDVVLAYGTTAREARESSNSLKNHVSHLVVHGVLHLLGYDHERMADATTMEKLETKILAGLKIPDPYAPTAKKARAT